MKSCLLRALITLFIGVFLLFIGGYFWTKSYLKGEEFMSLVQYKLSEKLGGEVQLAEAEWDGWILENEKVSAASGKGFSDLELERVSIEIDPKGFMERIWRVSDVHIRDASIHLGDPLSGDPEPFKLGEMPVQFDWKDIGKVWLPRRAAVDYIRVENCQGSFLTGEASGNWKELEILLDKTGSDYTFTTPRGEFTHNAFPEVEWEVIAGKGRLKSREFFITEGKLKGAESSILEITGEGTYAGKATLQGTLKDLPMDALLEETWKRKFLGQLEAEFIYKAGRNGSELTGIGAVENAALTALPVLDTIAKQTGISRFRNIPFQTCTFSFQKEKGVTHLSELVMDSADFLKVTGELQSDGTTGEGLLQLGLHSSVLEKLPTGIDSLFSQQRGDYFWAPVTLTQRDGEWKDDLSPRAMSALLKGLLSGGAATASDLLKGIKDALPATEGKKQEEGEKDLLKKGSDVMEKGVRSLFDLLGK